MTTAAQWRLKGRRRSTLGNACLPALQVPTETFCLRLQVICGLGFCCRYLRFGAWLMMLVVGWLLQKGLCQAGWPEDCASDCDEQYSWGWSCAGLPWEVDRLGEAKGFQQMLVYGLLSGWLNSIGRPRRFSYLFSLNAPPPVLVSPSTLSSHDSLARSRSAGEFEQGLIVNESTSRRAADRSLICRQRWRLPWFPLLFFATIPIFSRITCVHD